MFNGLIGKPNAAGLHKIRELVLTSKPRLVYIDLSINKIKGEINWDVANFPGLPQAIMVIYNDKILLLFFIIIIIIIIIIIAFIVL